ncbi:hypothetical protein [Marinifilum flexuosum]|uniref:Uncharacterized protein n=1 Tax=Marinifilum flexuosum TaxID=1117708 RepID=A0A419X851_9BACT|nr:hypothetical protein [Marinifilum flexuosum]RKE03923.1 hypothetical protein BXY64_0934 [Marinifilum flexuosum]
MNTLLKISLILLLVLSLLGIADYYIPDCSLFQDYIRGTFTETIGILVTIVLIEIILSNSRKKEHEILINKSAIRAIEMINISLENYNRAAFDIATPSDKKHLMTNKTLDDNFLFADLCELFESSNSLIFEGIFVSKIEVYFDKLDHLAQTIKTALYQVDLSYHNELSKLLIDFIKYIEEYYPKNGILKDKTQSLGDGKMKDEIKKIISEHTGNVEYEGTVKDKYVRLYEIIRYINNFKKGYKKLELDIRMKN